MTITSPILPRVAGGMLLIMTAITGCTSGTGYAIGVPLTGPPIRPSAIIIIDHVDPDSCRIVGRVHAHTISPVWLPWGLASQEKLLEKLKKEAALLHANAIIDIKRYSRSQFEWREEHLMGTAAALAKKEVDDAR